MYWATNAALSPATGSRLLVAAAAAEAFLTEIAASVFSSDSTSMSGLAALRYWPRPFTAACQRSSMRAVTVLLVESGDVSGSGQFLPVPLRIDS